MIHECWEGQDKVGQGRTKQLWGVCSELSAQELLVSIPNLLPFHPDSENLV